MRLILLCSPLLALALALPVHTQPGALAGVADYEHYSPERPVGSPGVFVGMVTAAATGRAADPLRISVYVPPRGGDSLCVDLVSRDGQYDGRFRFPRPRTAGRHTLTLPTVYAGPLRAIGPARLAPMAHVSRKCSDTPELSVPAEWGSAIAPHHLRVLLNPDESLIHAEVRVGNSRRGFPCARISEPDTTTWEYACEVDVSTARGESELVIMQQTFGGFPDPVVVRVWVPDAG